MAGVFVGVLVVVVGVVCVGVAIVVDVVAVDDYVVGADVGDIGGVNQRGAILQSIAFQLNGTCSSLAVLVKKVVRSSSS